MSDQECPIEIIERARNLAADIKGRELPLGFDPADLGWDENVQRIVQEHTNYEALSGQLEEWATAAEEALEEPCECRASGWLASREIDCPSCPNRWLAHQELAEVARGVAEHLYQTWLARKALADSRGVTS